MRRKDPRAVALGRKGGKKGGPARATVLTQEQRREVGRRAAEARWGKRRLALVREAKGESQAALAAALGIDEALLRSMETGRALSGPPALERIAQRYHVNMAWLERGEGPIFEAQEEIHYLGDYWNARACRAAVSLMKLHPAPLEFSQIDNLFLRGLPGNYGWVFRLHDRSAICLLPGEEKPIPMVRAVADLILAGHQFLGRKDLSDADDAMLRDRTATLADLLQFLRPPFRFDFDEVMDLDFLLPKQRAALERRVHALRLEYRKEEPATTADKLQQILAFLKEYPEAIESVLRMLQKHATNSLDKGSTGPRRS